MPRMVGLTARRVAGEPCAQTSLSVPVCGRVRELHWQWVSLKMAYRHDLPPLANDALLGTHIHHRAVQAAPGLLDQACDDEHARHPGDALELLPGAVAALVWRVLPAIDPRGHLGAWQLPVHPCLAGTSTVADGVAQVNGALEVLQVLFAALGGARPDEAAKVGSAGIAPDVGLWQQKDVDILDGGAAGELLQLGQSVVGGGPGPWRGGTQADSGWWCHVGVRRVCQGVVLEVLSPSETKRQWARVHSSNPRPVLMSGVWVCVEVGLGVKLRGVSSGRMERPRW